MGMNRSDDEFLARYRRHIAETRTLFSNSQKPERERMVVRALLRCIGEPFTDDEIGVGDEEPVDVVFRDALFQVRDFVAGRKRGVVWREREERARNAKRISDLKEPWSHSKAMSFDEISQVVVDGMSKKASRYGVENCSGLDALAYIDLGGCHLWPLEPIVSDGVKDGLAKQGWRSVSMLFPPFGAVLVAGNDAPGFLRNKVGLTPKAWPHLNGLFDA